MINIELDFDNVKELDESKFFGEILMPNEWFEKDIFSLDELFICQINLSELTDNDILSILPQTGTLFFFIDMKKAPYKSIIRYYDGELDAYTSFNDDFESDINVIDEIGISFDNNTKGDIELLSEDKIEGYDTCLLKICQDMDDLLLPINGDVYIYVNKKDILKKDFSSSKLVIKK